MYVYVSATLGHLAEGWEWLDTTLVRPTIIHLTQGDLKSQCSCRAA